MADVLNRPGPDAIGYEYRLVGTYRRRIMKGHIEELPDVNFEAERYDEDRIAFTISSDTIYTRAYLGMREVIELRKFLDEEIKQWLNS